MSATIHVEDGERVFPCRCGETHRGDYAEYDFGHHNCFHDEPLYPICETGQLMCPQCGKVFEVQGC